MGRPPVASTSISYRAEDDQRADRSASWQPTVTATSTLMEHLNFLQESWEEMITRAP